MRVAFLNRGREAYSGGDLIALDATMDALRRRGVECVETGWNASAIKEFDLAHMFHCNFDWSWGNFRAIKEAGKPYVLTPIYYPELCIGVTEEQVAEIVWNAECVLPFSPMERMALPLTKRMTKVVPNGTDPLFHFELPVEQSGVLCVAARSGDKNTDRVERICDCLEVDFHLVCGMSRGDVFRAYTQAKVFVNASGSERMSLTIGEALCAGCRVLATKENWGNSWYPGLVEFDPLDEMQLEHLIRWALSDGRQGHWDYRPNDVARAMTWDWVAEHLHRVYREVLA